MISLVYYLNDVKVKSPRFKTLSYTLKYVNENVLPGHMLNASKHLPSNNILFFGKKNNIYKWEIIVVKIITENAQC